MSNSRNIGAIIEKMADPDIFVWLRRFGYFDSGYLGYEAAERIDWVWEHRIDDLAECGL